MLDESTKSLPTLATKEQELALQANFYKDIADAGFPLIKKYFTNKQIRKITPNKIERKNLLSQYYYCF